MQRVLARPLAGFSTVDELRLPWRARRQFEWRIGRPLVEPENGRPIRLRTRDGIDEPLPFDGISEQLPREPREGRGWFRNAHGKTGNRDSPRRNSRS